MRIFFRLVGLLLVLLLGVLLWNTYRLPSRQLTDVAPAPEIPVSDSAVLHLSRAIQIPTISDSAQKDTSHFEAFVQFLENTYPRVHQHLERERINRYALLYQWKGSNPDLEPILLMGHYDVVPVIEGTESSWTKAPFSGAMQDGYLYGRGSLDDKSTVLGILESAEYLLGQDFQPERTVYLSFGHDEEVSGLRGGKALAQTLEKRGVKLEMVLDEGGTIKTDGVAGLNQPVALIGIAEKGYTSVQLTAHGEGGHSSMPPAKTSIGMLATAIDNLQKSPFATNLGGTVGEMLRFLGPEMPFMQKL
ncbi:MAG: M20/M25/M40 family metallo-hydrolase, partial [Bacteroidetes bacterium]|nr:M20/M25/M40 family metallo-hydrolase [Bacteroidota bacterium]